MVIFISIILTVVVCFFIVLGSACFVVKDKSDRGEKIVEWLDGVVYNIFMLLALLTYMFIVSMWSNMNALCSVLLLITLISFTSKFVLVVLKAKGISEKERQFSVLLSAITIIMMMIGDAVLKKNDQCWTYIAIVISVVLGFYVSLEDIVKDKIIKSLYGSVRGKIQELKREEKQRLIATSIAEGVMVIIKLLGDVWVAEQTRNEIQLGVGCGGILFAVIIVFLMNVWPREDAIRKRILRLT